MSELEAALFGPVSKQFCAYFYYLSIINLLFVFIVLIGIVYIFLTKKKDSSFYMQMIMTALLYFVFYFQNRILHTMCSNSI
jgi:uncharacterized membrane protein